MRVATELAYVRLDDGTVAELVEGDPVPDNTDADHLATLVAGGVVTVAALQVVEDPASGEPSAESTQAVVEPDPEAEAVDPEAVKTATAGPDDRADATGRGRLGKDTTAR